MGPAAQAQETDRRFPPGRRLRKRPEFLRVQERGRKRHTRHFVVVDLPHADSSKGPSRVGITVSKRVGSAVTRNRIKRLVREFVRQERDWLPAASDVVVIAKKSAAGASGLADVARDLHKIRGENR